MSKAELSLPEVIDLWLHEFVLEARFRKHLAAADSQIRVAYMHPLGSQEEERHLLMAAWHKIKAGVM